MKISKEFVEEMVGYYKSLDKNKLYDGKDFDNMYMTTFIQKIIDKYKNVYPVMINDQWAEIDSCEDLEAYKKTFNNKCDVMVLSPDSEFFDYMKDAKGEK